MELQTTFVNCNYCAQVYLTSRDHVSGSTIYISFMARILLDCSNNAGYDGVLVLVPLITTKFMIDLLTICILLLTGPPFTLQVQWLPVVLPLIVGTDKL